MDFQRGVILNVNKPAGWTSFDVVRKVRSLTKIKKIGHSGTLDPMATGVLLICTGKATRRVSELMNYDKEYVATIRLGIETDTLDITGKTIKSAAIPDNLDKRLSGVCHKFVGDIQQIPPMVSALKLHGKPLYKLARKGIQVPLKPRTVHIDDIQLLNCAVADFTIRVRCAKGTYIRALARDIGRELGSLGTLASLIRTRIGPYSIKEAWTINSFENFVREYFQKSFRV